MLNSEDSLTAGLQDCMTSLLTDNPDGSTARLHDCTTFFLPTDNPYGIFNCRTAELAELLD